MAFSRRKFIQTGVGSAVAVAASVAGAEALHTAMGNSESATAAALPETQALNLPPSPQAAGAQGGDQSQHLPIARDLGRRAQRCHGPDRMPEIPADKMTDAQKKAAEEFAAGRGTPVFGPFVPLLRSPEVMLRTKAMGDYLRFRSVLPPKVSEYAILITARHWSNEYEWAVHFPIAEKAGVNPDLLSMLAEGRQVKGVYETDQLTYEFCTELLTNKCVSDTTYHWAVIKIGEQGVIDLTALVGYYSLLALCRTWPGRRYRRAQNRRCRCSRGNKPTGSSKGHLKRNKGTQRKAESPKCHCSPGTHRATRTTAGGFLFTRLSWLKSSGDTQSPRSNDFPFVFLRVLCGSASVGSVSSV